MKRLLLIGAGHAHAHAHAQVLRDWIGAPLPGLDADRRSVRLDRFLTPQVYAVGDCADSPEPLPKGGVHALRMRPVLSRNLRAALGVGTAAEHHAQCWVLALLPTANGRAIASWGRWSASGRWVWRWEDHVDRRFRQRFAMTRTGSGNTPEPSHAKIAPP